MTIKRLLSLSAILMAAGVAFAQPLSPGGQFMDRILPMEGSQASAPAKTVWGAAPVQGRFLDNGLEPVTLESGIPEFSFWGGNVMQDADGVYHLYVAAWDAVAQSHRYWSNSDIYHAVSSKLSGPYALTSDYLVGVGHNPTVFQAKDGTYVLYALIKNRAAYRYRSSSLVGGWGEIEEMPTDLRGRALSTGSTNSYSNWDFVQRSDGSVYCMDRGGAMWVSEDGLSAFEEVYDRSAYPGGYQRYYEDAVVWRDEFQYHMIVNHWNDKIAYYSRSRDGFHWVSEEGTAYDPSVAVHPDGTKEGWTKFERPRVFQDRYGRAVSLNMAVIDVEKNQDLAGDSHSSKNIFMPLNPGLRMEVLNGEKISESTPVIKVIIYKEDGFSPSSDLDISSLRFGNYSTVNRGGGSKCLSSETDAAGNLVLAFSGAGTGLTEDEFAPKLLGKYADDYTPCFPNAGAGSFCYGYAKLRYVDYEPAFLSPALPEIGKDGRPVSIELKNYGLKASDAGTVIEVLDENGKKIAAGKASSVLPYKTAVIGLEALGAFPAGSVTLKVAVGSDVHTLQIPSSVVAK